MLAEDILIVKDKIGPEAAAVQYRIKAPKEDKFGRSVIVDVYQSQEDICPVKAMKKWLQKCPLTRAGQPAFRWSDGKPLTSRKLTEVLRERLTGYLEGGDRLYSTHSFRTGAASMLGTLGYSDSNVKALGRWNS